MISRTSPFFLRHLRRGVITLLMFALAACGGGGGGGGTGVTVGGGGTGGTGISVASVSEGSMVVGSVIVNGVRFDDTTATIIKDDSTSTRAALANGMVVKVLGNINDDRVSGTATRVEIENEVRGTVQTVNTAASPQRFTVVNQTVIVDDLTVYANVANLSGLVGGSSFVEVHGQRDAAGNIRATRVELIGGGSTLGDELRGRITTVNSATSFTINNGTLVTVNYAGATLSPAGTTSASFTVGTLVEVHGAAGAFNAGTNIFTATKVDLEDAEDTLFTPDASGKFEAEGFVTGFTATPGTFKVNGRNVQTTSSTRFEGGTSADLANGVKVEAEGPLSGGTIVAERIVFRRVRTILHGDAQAISTGARTVTVAGIAAQVNDLTDVRPRSGTGLGAITLPTRVEIRGYVDSTGTFVAERIDDLGNGGGNDFIQGRVTTKVGSTLTILGITGNVAGASQFSDASGNVINLTTFLNAVTGSSTAGTLVKLKGTFSGSTISVTEAELEN